MSDYIESVKQAGGEPRALSNDDDPAAVLDSVDGILLTGGLDVDPSFYGEAKHRATQTDPARDGFEMPLSREAVRRDLPLLAICRGVQVLNVAEGGTLIQDIPSAITSDLSHSVSVPTDYPAHGVTVAPGSKVAAATGNSACTVNSRHHQAVGTIASGFVASALSPDGVVEAIERPASTFCVGVQWHPENFWRSGEFGGLFREFVAAAARRRRRLRPGSDPGQTTS